jgi:hypothetical protein
VPNPHWHGALLNERGWYVVGWLMGLGIVLGLLLVVDYTNFHRWLRRIEPRLGGWGLRLRRTPEETSLL